MKNKNIETVLFTIGAFTSLSLITYFGNSYLENKTITKDQAETTQNNNNNNNNNLSNKNLEGMINEEDYGENHEEDYKENYSNNLNYQKENNSKYEKSRIEEKCNSEEMDEFPLESGKNRWVTSRGLLYNFKVTNTRKITVDEYTAFIEDGKREIDIGPNRGERDDYQVLLVDVEVIAKDKPATVDPKEFFILEPSGDRESSIRNFSIRRYLNLKHSQFEVGKYNSEKFTLGFIYETGGYTRLKERIDFEKIDSPGILYLLTDQDKRQGEGLNVEERAKVELGSIR